MKKFALLGAVAALATAGGVFAAWTFSGENVDPAESTIGVTVLQNTNFDSKLGTITIDNDFVVNITGNDTLNNNTPVATVTGTLAVKYESNDTTEKEKVKITFAWDEDTYVINGTDVTYSMTAIGEHTFTSDSEEYNDHTVQAASFVFTFTNTINTEDELTAFKTNFVQPKLIVTATKTA